MANQEERIWEMEMVLRKNLKPKYLIFQRIRKMKTEIVQKIRKRKKIGREINIEMNVEVMNQTNSIQM